MGIHSTRRLAGAGLLAAALLALVGTASAGWLADYGYRQQITVDPSMTATNLSGYPLLVSITDPGNPVFGNAASGQDVVFTAADGLTVLPREIERYSAATQELDAWVKTNVSATMSSPCAA